LHCNSLSEEQGYGAKERKADVVYAPSGINSIAEMRIYNNEFEFPSLQMYEGAGTRIDISHMAVGMCTGVENFLSSCKKWHFCIGHSFWETYLVRDVSRQ